MEMFVANEAIQLVSSQPHPAVNQTEYQVEGPLGTLLPVA
jgi:hypothetical protein